MLKVTLEENRAHAKIRIGRHLQPAVPSPRWSPVMGHGASVAPAGPLRLAPRRWTASATRCLVEAVVAPEGHEVASEVFAHRLDLRLEASTQFDHQALVGRGGVCEHDSAAYE